VSEEAQRAVHEAVKDYLGDDEIPVRWVLTIEVARPDGNHLAHRAGGGFDGTENPMAWTALGMLQAATRTAEDQVADMTEHYPDDDSEE
jgi:hypothetical protein